MDGILEELTFLPQTYKSILGKHYSNRSLRNMLGYKLNKMLCDGRVCCFDVSRFRHSDVMFYVPGKKYTIIVEPNRFYGLSVWCFHDHTRTEHKINAGGVYLMTNHVWERQDDRLFHLGLVYKVI